MKFWIARIILTIGYGLGVGTIGVIFFYYYYPLAIIIFWLLIVIFIWLLLVWSIVTFGWAHRNWRKK